MKDEPHILGWLSRQHHTANMMLTSNTKMLSSYGGWMAKLWLSKDPKP